MALEAETKRPPRIDLATLPQSLEQKMLATLERIEKIMQELLDRAKAKDAQARQGHINTGRPDKKRNG